MFWFAPFGGLRHLFACLENYRVPAGVHLDQLAKKCYTTKVLALLRSITSLKLHTSIVFLFIRTIRALNLDLAVVTINWVITKKNATMKLISVFILESSQTSTDIANLKERKRKQILLVFFANRKWRFVMKWSAYKFNSIKCNLWGIEELVSVSRRAKNVRGKKTSKLKSSDNAEITKIKIEKLILVNQKVAADVKEERKKNPRETKP